MQMWSIESLHICTYIVDLNFCTHVHMPLCMYKPFSMYFKQLYSIQQKAIKGTLFHDTCTSFDIYQRLEIMKGKIDINGFFFGGGGLCLTHWMLCLQ